MKTNDSLSEKLKSVLGGACKTESEAGNDSISKLIDPPMLKLDEEVKSDVEDEDEEVIELDENDFNDDEEKSSDEDGDDEDEDSDDEDSEDEDSDDDDEKDDDEKDDDEKIEEDEDEVNSDADEEIQEITDEDLLNSDEVPEITDEDLLNSDEVPEITDEDLPSIEPEEVEEITDEEVNSDADEEIQEITDEDLLNSDEVPEITDEDIENSNIDSVLDEETNEDEKQDDEETIDEDINEEATTDAVACLTSNGYACSVGDDGKVCVHSSGECNVIAPIADIDETEPVNEDEIISVLSDADSENPFYSVLIKGQPVASICLKDQANPDEVRAYFVSSDYPRKLASAIATGGVKNVLDTQKARRYFAKANTTEVANEMKAEAKKEMAEEVKASVMKIKDKFTQAFKLAVAGMNKNLFPEDNNLKAAVFAACTEFGLSSEQASAKTEEVFAQADSFFDTAIAKTMELMGYDESAFEAVTAMVTNSGISNKQQTSFASALEKGNNPIIASFAKEEVEKKIAEKQTGLDLIKKVRFGK